MEKNLIKIGSGFSFEEKLGVWFAEVTQYFEQEGMQEAIFDLPELLKGQGIDDGYLKQIEDVFRQFLKLSFILKNNEEKWISSLITGCNKP
ncbi:hypothetical protein [Bergeyella zoohelcum]|uniref:Uncharacterized protein n=1 Tax=Bergeyella zoohelcum TaxID=1015 RepID=A0A380ZUY4_9FLAO|nr:hypothetical protein [Bergeyella zoohelcum]SUV52578.1 Uncharacterised protein [Bergeyella zoohelcum]